MTWATVRSVCAFKLADTHLQVQEDIVLKGVVRAEKLPDPTEFISAILDRVKSQYIEKQYSVWMWMQAHISVCELSCR
jgi:nuclear GTP-binding protein